MIEGSMRKSPGRRPRLTRAVLAMTLGLSLLVSAPAGSRELVASSKKAELVASSKNFELINSISVPGIVVSGQLAGDTYFASSWQSGLYSYDVSDPREPVALGHIGPDELGVQSSENEQMATNGKVLLLSRFNRTPANRLFVIDVRNPEEMEIIATLDGGGGHTTTCLFDCKWVYGSSSGSIVDLRDPSKPVLLANKWTEVIGDVAVHDLTEVRPGLIVTSSTPMFAIDVSDPAKPRVLTSTDPEAPNTGHNNIWPRGGRDRFVISASEGSYNGRCELYGDDGKTLQVWRTDGWRKSGFRPAGSYTLANGIWSDGHPPVDYGIQGCSAHWAQEHPSFHDGGLVAMAAWSHGVRLLDISATGEPREVGYFFKDVQAAVDVEWVTDRLLYVVEDGSGGAVDIIEYTGPLPKRPGPLS